MKKIPIAAMGVLFGVTAIVTLIVRLPLVLVLLAANAPLEAERVTGTVWRGSIGNAWISGYPVGDIAVAGRVLPLLTGRASAHLQLSSGLVQGDADVTVGESFIHIENAALVFDLSVLDITDMFGEPMAGLIEATVPMMTIDEGRCVAGRIGIVTDTLQRSAARYGGEGFQLTGEGKCADGALNLPISGSGPEGAASVQIRIAREGYMTELTVDAKDAVLERLLEEIGFEQVGSSYKLIYRGGIPS